MASARRFLVRHRRRAARSQRSWVFLTGFLTFFTTCILFGIIGGALGGAFVFSWLQQDLLSIEMLAEQFIAGTTSRPSTIVAQNSAGDWEPIGEIVDPLKQPRTWQTIDTFPPLAPAAARAINPNFPAELLYQEVDPPPAFNLPYLDRLIEQNFGDQLREQYSPVDEDTWLLNTAYYGHLAFGLEAASMQYFQKPAADLSLAELALLAPIPLNPTLNPIDNFEAAKANQERVLDALVDQGSIDRETYVTARFSPILIDPILPGGPAADFINLVRRDAERLLSPAGLVWGEVTLHTTLKFDLQQQAVCLTRAHLGRLAGQPGRGLPSDEAVLCDALSYLPDLPGGVLQGGVDINDAAVVILDPRGGDILALATTSANDRLAVSPRHQPGSAFTPFPVVTAFSQGLSGATMLLDIEQDFGTDYNGIAYIPQNRDGTFTGPVTLRDAVAADRLVPAVELLSLVGPENAVRVARQLGVSSLDSTPNRYGLALVSGGGAVSVLEMAQAYGVLANLGQMHGVQSDRSGLPRPRTLVEVRDQAGNLIAEEFQATSEIVAPGIAFLVNDILSDQQSRCPTWGCPSVLDLPDNRPAAVKVGSTNDNRDAWTIGYTPQLVTAVWVGNRDQRPMGPVDGAVGAAPIWHALMGYVLEGEPPELWARPENIVERLICVPSGMLATEICPTRRELFISGTEPAAVDTIYREVNINRLNGRLATLDTPPDQIETKIFTIYPPAASKWVAENAVPQPPTEFDTLQSEERDSPIQIIAPEPFAIIQDEVEIRGAIALDRGGWYRISYFAGISPGAFFEIEPRRTRPLSGDVLGRWDTGSLNGLYTIVISVFRPDGTFFEHDIQVTVDQTPPTLELIRPDTSGRLETEAGRVTVEVKATDDLALAEVIFSEADGLREAIAQREQPPFRADVILESRCHTILVLARDKAGNETELTVGPLCPAG